MLAALANLLKLACAAHYRNISKSLARTGLRLTPICHKLET